LPTVANWKLPGGGMVGRTIQQYQLLEKLGAGGMGEIYKALDTRLNRTVAIKVLPSAKSGDPERRRRFLQEAQAASGLNHPSIITIHDVISDGDTEFMVMEYVQGKTLNDLIPKGGLRVPLLIKYALQMADALSAAHAAGIVHRDLKPANAMVTESGLVKVLDFGLAKLTDRGAIPDTGDDRTRTIATAPMTVEGSILGTVSYMSPEQAQGKKVDTRSDIFSFGAVLYEMATGVRAFEGESSLSTLSAILRDEAKPMSEVAPDVPPQLEDVIQRCLRKMPDDRWQNMKEVQAALSTLKRESDSGSLYTTRLSGVLPQPSMGPPSRGPKTQASAVAAASATAVQPTSSSKLMPVLVGLLLLLLVGGAVYFKMKQSAADKHAAEIAAQLAAATAAPPEPAPVEATPPAPPPDTTLTNDSVLDMVNQKVPSDLILSQIRSAEKTNFDLSTPEVIRLSNSGVTPLLIEQMRNPKRVPLGPPRTSAPQNAKQNGKQSPPVAAAAPPPPVPVVAPTPAPVSIAANPAVTLPPTPAPAPVVVAPQTVSVTVPDAAPFRMTLAADIPADAEVGRPIRFTASEDFKLNNVTVIAKGSPIQGEISETPKKGKIFGIGGSKLSFKLTQARNTAGHPIAVRALPSAKSDGIIQRPVDTGQKTPSKDIAAAQGALYIGYVDGVQTVSVPK
ncbi:MAG: serine/threonine-protein kinase, partial [Acidobacteriota bacterium]